MPRRRPSPGRGQTLDRFLEEAEERRLRELLGLRQGTDTTTTTTTSREGVKPPRWLGETSRQVFLALLILGRATLDEIARVAGVDKLDKEVVRSRLKYWRRRGLVVFEEPFWSISSRAAAIVERLLSTGSNRGQTGVKLGSNSGQIGVKPGSNQGQTCLGALDGLEDDERAVLNYLLRLREERGQNWTYVELLAEDLGFDAETLRRVLRRLQGRGLVYIWFDRRLAGVRVGLRLNC